MNALEIAEKLDAVRVKTVKIDILHNDAAGMLRRQHTAIKQLREALSALVYEGHWSADEKAKAALGTTEEFK